MAGPRKTIQFTCPYCPKRLAEASLKYHLQFHAAQELDLLQGFKCSYCQDTKETPRQLYRHVYGKHRGKIEEQKARDSKNDAVQAVLGRTSELLKEFWQDYAVAAAVASVQDGAAGDSVERSAGAGLEPRSEQEASSAPQGPSEFKLKKLSIASRQPPHNAPPTYGPKKRRRIDNRIPVSCASSLSCPMAPYKRQKSISVPEACEVCGEQVLGFSAYIRHFKHRHLIFEGMTFVCEFCDGDNNSAAEIIRTKAQAGKHTMKHSARLKKHKTMVLEESSGQEERNQQNIGPQQHQIPDSTFEAQRQDIRPLASSQQLNMPGPSRSNVLHPNGISGSTGPSTPVSSMKLVVSSSALVLKNDRQVVSEIRAFEAIAKREVTSPPQNGFLLHLQPVARKRADVAAIGSTWAALESAEGIVSPAAAAAAAAAAAPATAAPQPAASPNLQVDVKPAVLPIFASNLPPRRLPKKGTTNAAKLNKKTKPEPEVIFEGFRCPFKKCRIIFSTKAKLEAHRNEKRHRAICKRCPKLFDASVGSKYCRNCLRAIKLEEQAHRPENWTPQPPIECFDCSASFDSEPDFKKHLESDHGNETCDRKCFICCHTFKDASASQFYYWHLRTHFFDDERPTRCTKCPQKFKDAQDCEKHDKQEHQDSARGTNSKKKPKNFGTGAAAARHQGAFNRRRKSYKVNFYP